MQILLSLEIIERFEKALRSGGSREIGGLLFAEHVGTDTFRVVEISIQTKALMEALCVILPSTKNSSRVFLSEQLKNILASIISGNGILTRAFLPAQVDRTSTP